MASNGSRRPRGEGSIYWDEKRQRFLAAVTVGYTPAGKRIVRRGSGKTEAAARAKLKEVIREYEAGLTTKARNQTVRHAVEDWLAYGLHGRAQRTVDKYRILCQTHIISALGARKLRELTATDVDRWLAEKAKTLSTRTLRELHQCLNRSINRAMARDLVARNVVALCGVPRGRVGRPSKSLDFDQAKALLQAAQSTVLYDAYVTVSLLTGARTEELRALTWDHVDLDGQPDADPPTPAVDRRLALRTRGRGHQDPQVPPHPGPARPLCPRAAPAARAPRRPRAPGAPTGIVFASAAGTELDAANVRRAFRRVVARGRPQPGRLDPARAAPQLRLAALRPRGADREDRRPGRPLRHHGHREGLPPPAAPGSADRGGRHGPHLRWHLARTADAARPTKRSGPRR